MIEFAVLNEITVCNLQSTSTKKEKQVIGGIRRKSGGPKFELSDEQKADIKSAFALFDKESAGFIATRELKVHFLCV